MGCGGRVEWLAGYPEVWEMVGSRGMESGGSRRLIAACNALHTAMAADAGAKGDAAATTGVAHRLRSGVVTAILAVIIAVVISGPVVLGHPLTRPMSPRPEHGGIVSPAAGAGVLHPSTGQPGETRWGELSFASNSTSLAVGTGTAINLYHAVSITPASGWTVANQGRGYVNLLNSDKDVQVFAVAGSTNAPDINHEATADISGDIEGNGLINVQQDSVGQVQTVQGNNYQQLVEFAYTANAQSDQGTMQLFGFWVVLFNSSTQTAGFINFFSPDPDALNTATPDFKNMVLSMLLPQTAG
jgi:hypothetical protein